MILGLAFGKAPMTLGAGGCDLGSAPMAGPLGLAGGRRCCGGGPGGWRGSFTKGGGAGDAPDMYWAGGGSDGV